MDALSYDVAYNTIYNGRESFLTPAYFFNARHNAGDCQTLGLGKLMKYHHEVTHRGQQHPIGHFITNRLLRRLSSRPTW